MQDNCRLQLVLSNCFARRDAVIAQGPWVAYANTKNDLIISFFCILHHLKILVIYNLQISLKHLYFMDAFGEHQWQIQAQLLLQAIPGSVASELGGELKAALERGSCRSLHLVPQPSLDPEN
jgi:hypothetical protein